MEPRLLTDDLSRTVFEHLQAGHVARLRQLSHHVRRAVDEFRGARVIRLNPAYLAGLQGTRQARTVQVAQDLGDLLATHPTIAVLALPNAYFTGTEPQLAAAMTQHLRQLDLNHNCVQLQGLETISASVLNCGALTHLDLSSNFLMLNTGHTGNYSQTDYTQGALALGMLLARLPMLTDLRLHACGLYRKLAFTLGRALPFCRALRHLDLSHNGFGDGLVMILPALPLLPLLAHLNMSRCDIMQDVATIELFADVLPKCRALTHVILANNQIGNCLTMLNSVWPQLPLLQHLDLNTNAVNDGDMASLVRVLPQCPALTHLNITRNFFEAQATAAMLAALLDCPALVHLDVSLGRFANLAWVPTAPANVQQLQQAWAPRPPAGLLC